MTRLGGGSRGERPSVNYVPLDGVPPSGSFCAGVWSGGPSSSLLQSNLYVDRIKWIGLQESCDCSGAPQ